MPHLFSKVPGPFPHLFFWSHTGFPSKYLHVDMRSGEENGDGDGDGDCDGDGDGDVGDGMANVWRWSKKYIQ